jgi:hypothetical protein
MIRAMNRRTLLTLLGVAALVAACSSSTRSGGATTTSTTAGTSTTAPGAPATDTPTTAAASTAPTTAPATGPTASTSPCPPAGATVDVSSADPLLMSSLLGADIRTGAHPCYERVVIELMGTGTFPGWTVGYSIDPVPLGQSGEGVNLLGAATIEVRLGMWMQSMEGDGYQGDFQLFPTNVVHVRELRLTDNFEGMSTWAIGLDAQYPFAVAVLHAPERLVIDIYTG